MKKINYLITLIVCMTLITGCSGSHGGSTVINGADQIEKAKQLKEAEVKANIVSKKEDIERQYGSGFYFENFSEEISEINKYYERVLYNEVLNINEHVFYEEVFDGSESVLRKEVLNISEMEYYARIRVENEYYNDSLNAYREGSLAAEDFFEAPEKHVRSMDIYLTTFFDGLTRKEYLDDYDRQQVIEQYIVKKIEKWNASGIEKAEYSYRLYNIQPAKFKNYEFNQPIGRNDPYKDNCIEHVHTENQHQLEARDVIYEILDSLHEKYNEEFVFIKPNHHDGGMTYLFAPVKDETLEFSMNFSGKLDTYKHVLAQKILSEKVNAIIEEEGAEDFIVQFSAPVCFNTRSDPYEKAYDTSNVYENENFLDEVFLDSGYETSLYYIDNTGEYDYSLIHRIVKRIAGLIQVYGTNSNDLYDRTRFFVFFYDFNNAYLPMLKDRFYKEAVTYKYFRESSSVSSMAFNRYKTREDTDAFAILDVYGHEHEEKLKVLRFDESLSLEDFIEEHSRTSIYE